MERGGPPYPLPEIGDGGAGLGDAAAAIYGLEHPVRVRRLGEGLGPTFLVNCSSGQAVARVNDPTLRPERHFAFELDLLSRLEREGLPVAGPYPVSGGPYPVSGGPSLYAQVLGPGGAPRQVALYRFLRGHQPVLSLPSAETMGAVLADFHIAADRLSLTGDAPTLGRPELLEAPAAALRQRLTSPEGERDLEGKRAWAAIEPIISFLSGLWPWSEGASEPGTHGLVHGDSHHLNLREDTSGRMAILDFEHVAFGPRVYDLATLIWGTFGRGGRAEMWEAMVGGYGSRRPLGESEVASVPLFVCLRQLWWMGFHARHWGRWRRPWLTSRFFVDAAGLLESVAAGSCGYGPT